MPPDEDEFEGIEVNGPFGEVRVGRGGVRIGLGALGDDAEGHIRRRVRRRLRFYRNVASFALIVGGLALLDFATGGGWWVQWVAIIWGGFLALQFVSTFVGPRLWGREAEERMVKRELEREGIRPPESR